MAPRTILRALGGLAAALVLSTAAQAQLFRAYLAIDGNDANPCTLPQPCRLLPEALAAVPGAAGSLRVADSVLRGSGGWAAWIESRARGEFSGTRMTDNHGGVVAYNSATRTSIVSVADCAISGGMYGVWTNNYTIGTRLTVARSVIEGKTYALKASTPDGGVSVVTVSGSTITGNEYAWRREGMGSLIRTLGDNEFTVNSTSLGALTPAAPR